VKGLLARMVGVSMLRARTFEEVEADPRSLGQACLVVALACAAIALASWVQGREAELSERRLAFQVLAAGLLPALQALDFGTGAAVGTCLSAAVLLWLLVWGLSVAPLPF
jgi:hypothetical protein